MNHLGTLGTGNHFIEVCLDESDQVWFMLHSGYIRYFGKTIGLLAERGHAVHLAFTRIEKDPGDARLAHELADAHPNVTFGQAPLRRRGA